MSLTGHERNYDDERVLLELRMGLWGMDMGGGLKRQSLRLSRWGGEGRRVMLVACVCDGYPWRYFSFFAFLSFIPFIPCFLDDYS
jgi:hypothetical protein